MALSDYPILQWKRKAVMKKEQEEYEKWAFPYGEKQRENLQALLLAVFPKENAYTTMVPFLTCKELYETAMKNNDESSVAVIDLLINKQKKYKMIIKKKDMPAYIALVLADSLIDERAEYPSAAEIVERTKELEKMRRDV
ncbi:MAG: hypothetical protein FWC90_00300 [Oscillospiraceae bacterium]|nr:hypothetical protein [Oscillospiraceae bacterium]